jgi:hypothetical protein
LCTSASGSSPSSSMPSESDVLLSIIPGGGLPKAAFGVGPGGIAPSIGGNGYQRHFFKEWQLTMRT